MSALPPEASHLACACSALGASPSLCWCCEAHAASSVLRPEPHQPVCLGGGLGLACCHPVPEPLAQQGSLGYHLALPQDAHRPGARPEPSVCTRAAPRPD